MCVSERENRSSRDAETGGGGGRGRRAGGRGRRSRFPYNNCDGMDKTIRIANVSANYNNARARVRANGQWRIYICVITEIMNALINVANELNPGGSPERKLANRKSKSR